MLAPRRRVFYTSSVHPCSRGNAAPGWEEKRRKYRKTWPSKCLIPVCWRRHEPGWEKGGTVALKSQKCEPEMFSAAGTCRTCASAGRAGRPPVSPCIICEPSSGGVRGGVPAALFRAPTHQSAAGGGYSSSANKRSCSPKRQRPTLRL